MKAIWLTMGLAAAAAVSPAPASAQSTSDAERLRLMLECDSIPQESARLSCYDGAAHRARAMAPSASQPAASQPMPAPAPAAAAIASVPPPAAAASPEQSFGMESVKVEQTGRRKERPARLEAITAAAVSSTDDGVGHWTIALDNGGLWQLTERSPDFRPPLAGQSVRIRRGVLGSYLMDVGGQAAVRVMRVG